MNNDKQSKNINRKQGIKQSRAEGEKRKVNQSNRLFAHSVTDASSFILMEVNQHTGGGSVLREIWQAPKQD